MKGRSFLVGCSVLLFLFSQAQIQAQLASQPLEQFKKNNPGARFYGSQFYRPTDQNDEARGGMTAIYGTILSIGDTPEESALRHVNEVRGALGAEIGTLVPEIKESGEVTQGVMWNEKTQTHKFSVLRFNQYIDGIPVFRSGVGFLVRNMDNYPLVMSGFTVKDLSGARLVLPQAGDAPQVSGDMLENVSALMNAAPVERSVLQRKARRQRLEVEVSDEEYVIFAGVDGKFAEPELAVSFMATRGSVRTLPDYHKHFVIASAATGEILHEENQICHCAVCMVDVTGSVEGRATDGMESLNCDPTAITALPYIEVGINGGSSVFADEKGEFIIPNSGGSNVTVTAKLRGPWFEVFDEANGNQTPEITQVVSPSGPASLLFNPTTSDDLMTANVNAYLDTNVVRDYVLSYEPEFPTIATQTGFNINTNINSSCNAFYDGSSVNYYQAGGGCNNTAFSGVIYHEYGHHLINVTGNGQGQMGEGSGDSIGVLIQDQPVLGIGFSTCGSGIRNANNTKQYPCDGGIHDCGQLISGCVWSTRNELSVTEPGAYRDIGAALFTGMLITRGQLDPGQSTIAPDITIIYLELDDDDGNIGNGTPHYSEIAAGFGDHNMDAPPLDLIEFEYPNGRPDLIPDNGEVAFQVEVVGLSATPEPGSGVLHVDTNDGNGFQTYPMVETAPNIYDAIFPVVDCATTVRYYVSANSISGPTQFDPTNAPTAFYTALAADSVTSVYYDDAESNPGWTVSGDAVDGQWDRGVPVGGGDRGDPATDGDGSGSCWLTDNVDGNSDVDDGSTILTSNVLDASFSGNEIPLLKYRRFYDNVFGNAPRADVMVIDISNDGGATWSNLETVGPDGPEVEGSWIAKTFRISDTLAPTSNMRIRINVSDLGEGSVVEAGFDGLEISMAVCEPPTVTPLGSKFLDGVVAAGSLSDVGDSDDVKLEVEPSPTSNPIKQKIDVILVSESMITSPNSLTFRLEASMTGGTSDDVVQQVYLWNTANSSWNLVDTRPAGVSDIVVDGVPGGNLDDYVNQVNGEIRAKVRWSSPSFSAGSFFWSVFVDQAAWLID